jgi:hypothetical protein
MPNNNILLQTANNIEGNVSSCKTEISIINNSSRPSLFYQIDTGYATNNCTGETETYTSWELTETSVFLMVLLGIIAIIAIVRLSDL